MACPINLLLENHQERPRAFNRRLTASNAAWLTANLWSVGRAVSFARYLVLAVLAGGLGQIDAVLGLVLLVAISTHAHDGGRSEA